MKSIIFILLFLFVCIYSSFAQDFPSKPTVLKIIGDQNRKLIASGDRELSVETEIPFRFIDAKFNNLPSKECLVIVPVLYGGNSRDMVIHFSRANSTLPWAKDYMHIGENYPYSGEFADTIDIDPNDGLNEIAYSFSSLYHGCVNKKYQIISLKSGKEKILYSNNSFLLPGEDDYVSGLTIGDTVYEFHSNELKDIDNNGIKDIFDSRRIGLLLNKEQKLSEGETYWDMQIEEETYSIIYSFKNGLFVKSKPKLISSKTDDYYTLTADEETE